MNQREFEQLSVSLLNVNRKVKDKESLLHISCELLKADAAFLIRRELPDKSDKVILHHVYPPEYRKYFKENDLNTLRKWYDFDLIPRDIDGFTKEGPIKIGDLEFPDALVAFGFSKTDNLSSFYEMILLKKRGDKEPYRSYHSWAAAQLIHQFEFFELQDALKSKTKRNLMLEKQLYAAYLSANILPDESWEGLKKRIEKIEDQKDQFKDISFKDIQCLSYVIWTAYQVRKEKEEAGYQYDKNSVKDELKEKDDENKIYADAVNFLLDSKDPYKDDLFAELKKNINHVKRYPSESEERKWTVLSLLVLEHAWRNLKKKTDWRKNDPEQSNSSRLEINDFCKVTESAQKLLKLTRSVIIQAITSEKVKNNEITGKKEHNSSEFQKMGRGFLRLYLAQEIAKPNSKLKMIYLGNDKKTDEHSKTSVDGYCKAPTELKRTFILNLSRFMLSVVALLQKDTGIQIKRTPTNPPVIGSSEELDSLFYLIDRFVHVELEVDERINFRDHLTRQIGSEVSHYLRRPHYRDHLLHVIDVFLLGYLLLNTKLYWVESRETLLVDHLTELAASKRIDDQQPILKRDWMRNWAVASLLHDIGYQIGNGSNISSDHNVWKSYFALACPVAPSSAWLKFKSNENNDKDSQSLKNLLDSVKNLVEGLRNKREVLKKYIPAIDKNNDSYITKDHGMLSALRIAQVICHADHKTDTENKPKNKPDNSDLAVCYRHAIHAIAYHNLACDKVYFDSHPLACLLRLCDELQDWDRRRVNMEKTVKHLYLDLQKEDSSSFSSYDSYEMIDSFEANLDFQPVPRNVFPTSMEVSLKGEKPCFKFAMLYRDSIKGHFDPTMTLLCKAYNLQHVDFSVSDQGHNNLKFTIKLKFPRPKAYRSITEYDIYALFTEKVRFLPLLRQFSSIKESEAGLVHLECKKENFSKQDCFGILLTGASKPGHHHGWLSVNPNHFFKQFIEFKKDILGRIGGGNSF
jgi:hypothetical protein